jgi:hypothetical protein
MTLAQIVLLIRAENAVNGETAQGGGSQMGTVDDLRFLASVAG